MEQTTKKVTSPTKGLLQSDELYQYILETSVYPREPELLKELREVTASHPRSMMGTAPDAGQLMAMLLKLVNAKNTIEIGNENEGSFDFAFVDADKVNYLNYHERLMKLVKVGGIVVYDNTLWGGSVAMPEESVPEGMKHGRHFTIELNKSLASDPRILMSHAPLGDGITICKRIQ
ncbi:hypothetical protein ACSBR2_038406 [Camellia fascicularis]